MSDAVRLVAKKNETGLMLFTRTQDFILDSAVVNKARGSVAWVNRENASCVMAGCFSRSGSELKLHSQVGSLDGNLLSTDGTRGLLFFGPYARLRKGEYRLRLLGDLNNVEGAILDIVSDQGKSSHFRVNLSKAVTTDMVLMEFPFTLKNDVDDLEVRLYVESVTSIRVKSYEIVVAED